MLYYLKFEKGQPPYELLTYILCSEMYHCTPSQLERERVVDVMPHLIVRHALNKHGGGK